MNAKNRASTTKSYQKGGGMSNCSCIYIDNYESADFHTSVKRKAIKNHRCCECGRTINRGETYEYVSGKWDSYIGTYKTCGDCLSIRNTFFCDGWLYEGMTEALWEHLLEMRFGEISEDCIAELTPGGQALVCGMIEEIWKDYFDEDED